MADKVIRQLSLLSPGLEANFDLDDCDKVLRVKSGLEPIDKQVIIQLVESMGGHIEILE